MPLPLASARDLAPRAVRELHAALRAVSFYPPHHPSVGIALERILATLGTLLETGADLELGLGEKGVLYQGEYLPDRDRTLQAFASFLLNRGLARLVLKRGLDRTRLEAFLRFLVSDPATIAQQGGLGGFLTSRNLDVIQVSEIDAGKILASDATLSSPVAATDEHDKEVWKRLVTDFLRGPDSVPQPAVRKILSELAKNRGQLIELVAHLAEEAPQDLPGQLGCLADEIRKVVPGADSPFMENLGYALEELDPHLRLDLFSHRIPLSDGTPDLIREITRKMPDSGIADLIGSFVEAEHTLSPRLVSVCSKVFATRGQSTSYFGAISERLKGRKAGGQDLTQIWRSLQGLLAEPEHEYISQTYRDNLEAVAGRVEPVDAESRRHLMRAPGFTVAFEAGAIAEHTCRVLSATLEVEPDSARHESLRGEIEKRAQQLTEPGQLPLLVEVVRSLLATPSASAPTPGRPTVDQRAARVSTRMLGIFRTRFSELNQEERAGVLRLFEQAGNGLVPVLIDALAEEDSAEVRKSLMGTLASLGRNAMPLLLERLNDSSERLVRNTVLLLGEMGDTRLVEPLSSLLRHREARIRREAALAIGKIGGPRAIRRLREALHEPEVRPFAARVLGEIDRVNTVKHFAQQLARPPRLVFKDGPIREAIALLGEIKASEAVPVLSRILRRRLWIPLTVGDALRAEAAQALWCIGTDAAKEVVRKAAASTRVAVRKACRDLSTGQSANPGPGHPDLEAPR